MQDVLSVPILSEIISVLGTDIYLLLADCHVRIL